MKTVFETCRPREEVLRGELTDEMFAARLKDVVDGTADPIYGDANRFFENTFFTEGLKTLLREVAGRLSGAAPANSPFVRLETSFGGGKTHNLIALWHVAAGKAGAVPADVLPRTYHPVSSWRSVGLVGSDLDPANGVTHGAVRTKTLWGELAWQLGGEDGLALVRESDTVGAAPGTGFLEKLVGDGPCLVMLDEMARYLRSAKAVATANGRSDLAEQTVAFLMSLVEFAASRPKVSIVLTLADSRDAFGPETDSLRKELEEARRVTARQERVLTPTGETEISRIVTHRLFAKVDPGAARETAHELSRAYEEMIRKGAELPSRASNADYRAELEQDYPFHPELVVTLDRKTSTIPNFQKTRGALRLLARVVRGIWNTRPKDAFTIGIHHIDLSVDDIANDLTSRLERPQFRSVIEADLASSRKGSQAHCDLIDRSFVSAGRPPYAGRAATVILLHSLTQGVATGVELGDILLSVLGPDDDPQVVRKVLSRMLGEEKGEAGTSCWFLHFDGLRYRFKTEPNLEKVVQDELMHVGRTKARQELDQRIKTVWKKGVFDLPSFPSEPSELPDDAGKPKLAILHYDAAPADGPDLPDLVVKLFERSGTKEGFRGYKNNVLFLAADKGQIDRMVDVAQRHLALERLLMDAGRLQELSEEQRKRLRAMRDTSELDVRVAITRAYRHLYYPSSDAPKGLGLAHELLPTKDQGDIQSDQSSTVLQVLKQLGKTLTAEDPALAPAHVKSKAWPTGQANLSTEDLRREFARRVGLRILLDPNQLKKTIRTGVSQGTWIYYDARERAGYGKTSPPPLIELSDDALLYMPDEAQRLGLPICGEETDQRTAATCPMCGKEPCVCGDEAEAPATPSLLRFSETGPPGQIFQRIADRFADAKAGPIGSLEVSWSGSGKEAASEARAFGLAIPQLPKGDFRLEQEFVAEFDGPLDALKVSFQGSVDRYRRVKTLTDEMGKEARNMNAQLTLHADYPAGLPAEGSGLQTLRDVFTQLGLGTLTVTVSEKPHEGGK